MKQKIFTLVLMLALVVVGGKAFAQSTALAPYVGATHVYTFSGLTNGNNVAFTLELDTIIGGAAVAITHDPSGATVSGGEASDTLFWDPAVIDPALTYYLWIAVSNASGCYNYRYVRIDPVPNIWDVTIAAIAIGDTTDNVPTLSDTWAAPGDTASATCAVIDPNTVNYDITSGTGSVDNGETWVYYRINRVNGTNIAYDWTFDFQVDGTTTNIEASLDGTTWFTETVGSITVTDAQDVYYIRVGYDAPTTALAINAYVDGTGGTGTQPSEATSGLTDSSNETNDVNVTINPIPEITGGFTGE